MIAATSVPDFSPSLLAAMRAVYRAPESELLPPLVARARLSEAEQASVLARGAGLLGDLRAAAGQGWVNQFLQQYRLNTSEGVALLSLAEAFLRVPDPDTADALIADKLGDGAWADYRGRSPSRFVNAGTWGLVISRALVADDADSGVLRRLISRAGEPFVRQAVGAAMRLMGQVFVMGRTIEEAIGRMGQPENRGFTASFDMLGEAARTYPDGLRYHESYAGAIAAVGRVPAAGHSISVKLSALHPRYEVAHWDRCVPELIALVAPLAAAAASAGVALTIDAEESDRLEMSLAIISAIADMPALSGWDGLGMAVQAYGKRARAVVAWAEALGVRTGRRIPVRLVKGAYWDSEIKHTQELGLEGYPLFTRKSATDVSYLAVAREMLDAPHIAPAFATHNARTVATVLEWAGRRRDFEFQRLHGMGDGLYERLVQEEGYACRIYAPVGGHRDLLAYLVRRLLENGANSSFVHQLGDARLSDADLLADPVAQVDRHGGRPHPAIPLPVALYGDRRNSAGLDLADRAVLRGLAEVVAQAHLPPAPTQTPDRGIAPLVAIARGGVAQEWARRPVEARAAVLERLADVLEAEREGLIALLVHEARKTLGDALAEVREAIDFCRYYAVEARRVMAPVALPGPTGERNHLSLAPRGCWAAIAPWNFPLAIFLGQVAAALVTGNSVLAKPAPQTPRVGAHVVALAHRAGVPAEVLQLVVGGAEVGAALVADPGIAGVAFTGSTRTARSIARALVAGDDRPLVPLIAETGGINAMIVDSTALPEQVVTDVVTSAFRSAGQRCSALRLLLLQEEIAESTLIMLIGAMDALIVGDPTDPATDVGPVIDTQAATRLNRYRDRMRPHWVHTVAAPTEGNFVAPTVIRLGALEDLTEEWFGPLLHVATWKGDDLDGVIARVNAMGYGLTMGLHSRIAQRARAVEGMARVGNLYINRSMIGAVVGSQPFGGEGLSGTGPKAGGPHYLPRFCVERTVSIDTTSAGGNASLLSLDEDAGAA